MAKKTATKKSTTKLRILAALYFSMSLKTIKFESDNFSIFGVFRHDNDWCEFSVKLDDVWYQNIGGESYSVFRQRLADILHMKFGRRRQSNENDSAPFLDVVSVDSEYFGYLVVSGYNTLLFYGVKGVINHVVLANTRNELLAHAFINSAQLYQWSADLNGE